MERASILLTLLIVAFLSGWSLSSRHASSLVFTPVKAPTAIEASPSPALTGDTATAQRININTADAELLQTLPEIGEKRASDIIAYREAHGPFTIPEQLSDVPGIGSATLNVIIDLITVEDDT